MIEKRHIRLNACVYIIESGGEIIDEAQFTVKTGTKAKQLKCQ